MGEYESFQLSILLSGAAFADDPHAEVARILRKVADEVEIGIPAASILDYNGNTVGDWDF